MSDGGGPYQGYIKDTLLSGTGVVRYPSAEELLWQAKSMGILHDRQALEAMKYMATTTNAIPDVVRGATQLKRNVGKLPYFAANNVEPLELLATRLRIPHQSGVDPWYWFAPQLDFVNMVFDDAKAFITVVAKGKATVIEDDAKNFPTDELVAQFRLLLA
jgi:hypothetical protein